MVTFLCKVEYTKKGGETCCTGCKTCIQEGSIRFANVHHGTELSPKWYDLQCFFKQTLIQSLNEVENYQNLRPEDKEEIRKELESLLARQADKKKKGKRSANSAKDPTVECTEEKRSKPTTSKSTNINDETKKSSDEVVEPVTQKAKVSHSELESLMKKRNDVKAKIQPLKNHTRYIFQCYNSKPQGESASGSKEIFIDSTCDLVTPLQELIAVMMYTEALKETVAYERLKLWELGTKQITSAISFLKMLQEAKFNYDKEAFLAVTNELNNALSYDYGPIMDQFGVSPLRTLTDQDVDKFFNLLNFEIAFGMLSSVEGTSPIQDYYNKLNASITIVDKESKAFEDIAKYVENSQCKEDFEYSIGAVFKVGRHDEENRSEKFNEWTNRYLLWHGTRIANVSCILAQGLKAMYGAQNGIFFADRLCKSARYCRCSSEGSRILILCEVALGDFYETSSYSSRPTKPSGKDSVKQTGKMQPDMFDVGETETGALIPFGKTLQDPRDSKNHPLHNEFVINDPMQVRLRYLVEIKIKINNIIPLACGS